MKTGDGASTTTISTTPPLHLGDASSLTTTSDALDGDYDDSSPPPLDSTSQSDQLITELPPGKLNEFLWTPAPTSHALRRRAMLQKYPEIEQLYGSDPWQIIPLIGALILQYALCIYVSKQADMAWPKFLVLCFTVSATLNHTLFAALHEASHRTMVGSKLGSELLSIIATLPMGLPAAIPFKRYHLDHHIYMGVETMDPDLPTAWEGRFFRSFFLKALWMLMLPFTYSLRPMIVRPKPLVPMDLVAWVLCFGSDAIILYTCGVRGLLYFLLGTFFSMNYHPLAGHFLSEHFVFPGVDIYQETSSYYGLMNLITFNVGYHNEHHDFPRVAGSRLPLLRKIAPEFYDIPSHDSWFKVTWKFLLSPDVTPFNRIKRTSIRGGPIEDPRKKANVLHDGLYPAGGLHRFWPSIKTDLKQD